MFFQILFRVFKGMLEMDGVVVDKVPVEDEHKINCADSTCQAKAKP